jgi:hypothetical protein
MTRVEAAAFVEALDHESSEALEDAVSDFTKALRMSITAHSSRLDYWRQQLWACKERLIDRLSGSESTEPTPRPL